jgi:ATPase subunit of ABC transporter with duplicated ATPase domains
MSTIKRSNTKIGYLDQYAKMDGKLSIHDYLSQAFSSLLKENEELEQVHQKINLTTNNEELEKLVNRASRLRERLESHSFYQIDSEIMKVASGLGLVALGMDTLTSRLSGGQKVKVMLAKVLLEDPEVLILDEPTNFLDHEHVEWLMKFLKEFKGSFLIVSHNEEFLNNVVNRIIDLEFTHLTKYKGNYQEYLVKKAMRIEDYTREYEREQKQIAKLEDYIARNKVRASTARLAKSREKQLDKITPLEKPQKLPKTHFSFTYKSISASKLLEVNDLEIGYYYSLLPKMSFTLRNREKISLQGFNGIGKSTLLKTLIGDLKPINGGFKFFDDVIIGYYAQDHIWANPKLTPLEEIQNEYPQLTNREVRTRLASVGLIDKLALQPLETLSGGEQAKVKLCKILFKPCNVLLLDEPTNHLDHDAKETLIKAIRDFPGSVIFVTHENEFASEITDKVFNIEKLLED